MHQPDKKLQKKHTLSITLFLTILVQVKKANISHIIYTTLYIFHSELETEVTITLDILAFTSTNDGKHRNTVVMSNGEFNWEKPQTWNAMLDRLASITNALLLFSMSCSVLAFLSGKIVF